MLHLILNVYRAIFARKLFHRLNKLLYLFSLSGMGVLNYQNDRVTGERSFLKNFLKNREGGVVFDVGANVGDYSQKILDLTNQLTVYAFEPHPKTFLVLKNRIDSPNFIPIKAAASDTEGFSYLYDYEDKDGSSHASLYRDVIETIHKAKSVKHKIRVLSLGDFAKSKDIKKISLLKIDAEGNELNILKGILEYLKAGRIEAIHFEFNEMNVSSRTYFKDFWELLPNYDFYRLLPNELIKLENYNPIFCEIFAYQNIVALLKRN